MLSAVDTLHGGCDDGERIERIRLLEQLKGAVAAAQARETAAFAASRRAHHAASRTRAEHVERDIAGQVALARRISPHRARRYVGFANILTTELPETFGVLARGDTSEWRAMLIAQHTIWLSREHRSEVDRAIAPRLPNLGDKRVQTETCAHAYKLDPKGYTERLRQAEKDRRVGIRPVPEGLVRVSALLPLAVGVGAYAALRKHADALRATGDPRSRQQIMADTFAERLLGRSPDEIAIELELIMTDQTLFGQAREQDPAPSAAHRAEAANSAETGEADAAEADAADFTAAEPAWLVGYGPVPADYARDLVLGAESARRWIRRLFRSPDSGELIAMESRRRLFTPAQRQFLRFRDQFCRTAYCEAPIRHADHVVAAANGGPTDVREAQGTCENCNQTKEAPGWRTERCPDGSIEITTPTGHAYLSPLPRPPGSAIEFPVAPPLDQRLPRAG